MIEALSSAVVTIITVALFLYWFRYSCLLILCTRTPQNHAGELAKQHSLAFLSVQQKLDETAGTELDGLRTLLDRDYVILRRLLLANTGSKVDGPERLLLGIDYRLMALCYRVRRHFSTEAGRQALREMSSVLAYFADSVGEATATAG